MLLFYLISLMLAARDCPSVDDENKSSKFSSKSHKQSSDPYWDNQKQYMVNMNDFCGELPEELQAAVAMMNNKHEFAKFGLFKTSNFIFYGPPGTGKTYIASIFAQKIGAEFMYVQGNELLDQWQGAGVRKPAELFKKARNRRDLTGRPVVMFLDEIDTVIGSRNNYVSEGTLQLIGSMLKEIGAEINNNIIVVAATNNISGLDAAFLRSGRFEHHVKFNWPSAQDRYNFLKLLTQSSPEILCQTIDWQLVANRAEGYSPADLKKLIDTLKMHYVMNAMKQQAGNVAYKISSRDILAILVPFKK